MGKGQTLCTKPADLPARSQFVVQIPEKWFDLRAAYP